MESRDLDRFIERYAEERRHVPRQVALQHLLSHAYMVSGAGEIDRFFKVVRMLLVLHIESLALFENPLRNAQFCLLFFFPVGFAYSLYLAALPECCLLGLIYCAATVIYGTSLFIMVIQKCIDNNIEIAYYREIIDFIDSRQFASSP
jgi:hypothetical protein